MGVAFFWGALGSAALLVGAFVAYGTAANERLVAVVMALGAGLLIGSVSFELVDEAVANADVAKVGAVCLLGAAAFTLGDWILQRRGGRAHRTPETDDAGQPLAIVLGSVLDGIPESFVLGLTVREGGVSVALLVGIVLSNLPEGMSSSSGLRGMGWPLLRVAGMWSVVVLVSGISAALGYAVLEPGGGFGGSGAQAFAAGALLAMVADTMLPESYRTEGVLTGSLVVAGFSVALFLSAL